MKKTITGIGRIVLLMIIVMMAAFYTGCAKEDLGPTGYPDGELQAKFLYYHDTLYIYSFEQKAKSALVSSSCEIGSIREVNNVDMPGDDLSAAHLEIGDRVFAKGPDDFSELYVETAEGGDLLEIFVPYAEE